MFPPVRLSYLFPHPSPLGSSGLEPSRQTVSGLSLATVAPAAFALLGSVGVVVEATSDHCTPRQELVSFCSVLFRVLYQGLWPMTALKRGSHDRPVADRVRDSPYGNPPPPRRNKRRGKGRRKREREREGKRETPRPLVEEQEWNTLRLFQGRVCVDQKRRP